MSDAANSPTRRSAIAAFFTDHPATVNETYFGHMKFALSFSGLMALAAGAAFLHAFIPALCETTASRILKKMNAKIEARH